MQIGEDETKIQIQNDIIPFSLLSLLYNNLGLEYLEYNFLTCPLSTQPARQYQCGLVGNKSVYPLN